MIIKIDYEIWNMFGGFLHITFIKKLLIFRSEFYYFPHSFWCKWKWAYTIFKKLMEYEKEKNLEKTGGVAGLFT